jgi:hypothetical protein
MVVNDNACFLDTRVDLESIASKLAPTEVSFSFNTRTYTHQRTIKPCQPPLKMHQPPLPKVFITN